VTVEAIRFQNFMAFRDTGWVELRPITLLFGRNSSGKSVLIRALLLLRRSLRSVQKEQPFVLSDLYGVDIGSFREMVHQGDEKSRVCFHFRCKSVEIEEWLATSEIAELRAFSTRTLQIALEYAARRNESGGVDLSHIDLTRLCIHAVSADAQQEVLLFEAMALEPEDVVRFGDVWFVRGLLTEQGKPGAWSGFGCKLDRNFLDVQFIKPTSPKEATGYQLLVQLLQILKDEIRTFLEGIVHLGPIRPEPQRRYSFSRNTADEWQRRDWTTFRDFIAGRLNEDEVREISAWLKRLDLAESVETRLVSEVGALFTEFEVAFQESGEAMPLPLSAMGFGASQVLPIIVQCVKANQGGLVIIEQPELHLHPRAQAELADLFIAMARNGTSFLIETHSEHLLLRLRRRIAESSGAIMIPNDLRYLRSHDLRACFIDRTEGRSSAETIQIDEKGKMSSPPGFRGFFADDLHELAMLNQAILGSNSGV
jgi:predicted ATPase